MNCLLSYDRNADLDVRWAGTREQDGYSTSDLTFLAVEGQRRAASLVKPLGEGPYPVILFVHWYEPAACDSNRTQFFEEACILAKQNVMSLLVETMWSDREWFLKRTQADDYGASVQQAIELRRAMDLLLAQPGADPSRLAYVGHDFGAMYGALAGSVDQRQTAYVLMAGTPRFPDWFLYYPALEGDERGAFVDSMAELDPIERVANLAPTPILFQFGESDPHVPVGRGREFADAAGNPKTVKWYDAGHGLSMQARSDRIDWLSDTLGLSA